MKRGPIYTVIIIGILSIISIGAVQGVWIKRTIQAQRDAVVLQNHQDSLNIRHFEESVTIALKEVIENIRLYYADQIDLYGAVKQQQIDYFYVDIHKNVPPFFLEQLLKRSFYSHNITEDFQYGIYNCYNDSVYGNFIHFTKDSLYKEAGESVIWYTPPQKIKSKEGHFFYIYFPHLAQHFKTQEVPGNSPWLYFAIISMVILIFFSFSISVIIRQKRISEVRKDFVNNMTHELKTPISTIGLTSELMMSSNQFDLEKQKKYSSIIYKENKRLEQQVEGVLNMAKLDQDKIKLHKETIEVNNLIEEIADSFSINHYLNKEQLILNMNAKNDVISADLVHISNIIINLLDNAVKYSKEKPFITAETINKDAGIVIKIKDNGIGIPKPHISQIFDQFYRVPMGDKHNVKGFGLGLYYTKIIVESHGGKIKVSSKLKHGTTFSVWLPTV